MHTNRRSRLDEFDQLNPAAQQRLRARVADAGGDIAAVVREIRAQIDELDRGMESRPRRVQRRRKADRAVFVAQLRYLELLERAEARREQQRPRGLVARIRTVLGRLQAFE